jgi:hypothetical protein
VSPAWSAARFDEDDEAGNAGKQVAAYSSCMKKRFGTGMPTGEN